MSLITVKSFSNANELAIPKAFLESHGIKCFIKNENVNQVKDFWNSNIYLVELQVDQRDFENSVSILIKGGFLRNSDLQPQSISNIIDDEFKKVPFLKNLSRTSRIIIAIILFVLLVLIIVYCQWRNRF